MSASKKLTERQIAEQKEAKKIKLYTIIFGVAVLVFVAIALFSGVTNAISNSGSNERKTIAATVGSHEISNAELSYYYIDAVNDANNTYSNYGFSVTSDMADMFIDQAISTAQTTYSLVDAAKAEGFTLDDEQKSQLDIVASNLDVYAKYYNMKDASAYLKAMYGKGATKESYLAYCEMQLLAGAYNNAHLDSLTYTDAQIREADDAAPGQYNNYSYNQYIVSVNNFLKGGTTGDDGSVTYSDEEKAAALADAQAAVAALTDETIDSAEALDAAIAALSQKETAPAASTAYASQTYGGIRSDLVEWVTDPTREAGDVTSVPVTTKSTNEAGEEVETISSYCVALFNNVVPNDEHLINVRHILVGFTGDTNEDGTYTDEAKAQTLASAEEILEAWKNGDATEESFAALATEKSTDTGSVENGGLYENVYPGQMVSAFNDWCFAEGRKAGDTDIVETNFGYHVMYFVGTSDQTYRDYRIENDLRNSDMSAWRADLLENVPVVNGDTSYMRKEF